VDLTTEAWASSTAPRGMRKRGRRGCCSGSSGHAAAAACRSDRAAGERPLHCLRKRRACNRTERARERERAREQKGSLPPLPFFFPVSREGVGVPTENEARGTWLPSQVFSFSFLFRFSLVSLALMAPTTVLTRFRHTSGDILLPCSPTARIFELKERLCAAWPRGKKNPST